MLSAEAVKQIQSIYADKTAFLVGCMALGLGNDKCYYDVAIYPGGENAKKILDFKERVIIIPVNSRKEFFKGNTVLIYAPNFDYQYAVEGDEIKYYRKKALSELKRAMDNVLFARDWGNSFLKASIMNAVNALMYMDKVEPASSHIFKQASDLGDSEISNAIETARLDENLGALLKARATLMAKQLDAVDSVVFSEKMERFIIENKQIEASAYLYHKLSRLQKNTLALLNQGMKLGSPSENEIKHVINIIKKASDRLSTLI